MKSFLLIFLSLLPMPLCAAQALSQAHAHNDYYHSRPFWDAYEHGFCSIEVDVYVRGQELIVAHNPIEVLQNRSLQDLYLEPLKKVVNENGGRVYSDRTEPITLLVDIKREGDKAFPVLKTTLEKYKAMLCCIEDGVYQKRAVKVVISGARPIELIKADPSGLMSIDGRLSDLKSDLAPQKMPLISDRWSNHFKWRGQGEMPENEKHRLHKFATEVHRQGRMLRFWATPESESVWEELRNAGVDLINTDNLGKLRELLQGSQSRSLEEAKDGDTVTRLGLIGCHRQDKPAPAFNRYLQASPDAVIWIGDNVYADTNDDISYIEKCYQRMAAQTAFQKLADEVPFVVTWDDHDFGLNNEGKNYQLKDKSRRLFRKFWKMEDHIPEDLDGVYHARYFGTGERRLQLIMLDTRYNRDDEGETSDTLGEPQWAWLENELKKPARLRLIASGYQVLLNREQKFETWAKFPSARKRLFELVQKTNAEGVIFLAGDQHYGEVSRIANAIGYDAIEFMFAGINQAEEHVYNTHRVSQVAHALNAYALIDIQWEKSEIDAPHVVFRCFDADTNKLELSYRVNFEELMPAGK